MRSLPRFATVVLAALVGSTCTSDVAGAPGPSSATPAPVTDVKIAFFEDRSPDGAITRLAPAFQGARLALDAAALSPTLPVEVDLVTVDTGGDPQAAAEAARQVAEDPAFVGAIGAPYLGDQESIGEVLDAAGVPTITLSGLDSSLADAGWTTWRRAVPTQANEAAALARYVGALPGAARGACLANGGGRVGAGLLQSVTEALESPIALRSRVAQTQASVEALADSVNEAGCGVLVWGGFAIQGAVVRRSLVASGLRHVAFVGSGGIKDDAYLRLAGRAGHSTVATCPCADLSTSTTLAARRFIQDYQAAFGLPPGPYAAEAWDVTHMFLEAIREGATSRGEVAAYLGGLSAYEGLAGTYAFGGNGELAPETARMWFYEDDGGRWLSAPQG
jgi:branched-chain amino acid transport system substrate-binding protein